MSSTNPTPSLETQQLVDQRLDTIDQTLMGLLPRKERLAIVSQVESRINELITDGAKVETVLREPSEQLVSASSKAPVIGKKRSRLAVSSGVLGIVALALLIATPLVYIGVSIFGELMGELVAIIFLGGHVMLLAVGGTVAVALGIAALVRLGRSKEKLVGHGWAITGLCTGPLPMLIGGPIMLFMGLQLLGAVDVASVNVPTATVPASSYAPVYGEESPSELSTPYMPEPLPSSVPSEVPAMIPLQPDHAPATISAVNDLQPVQRASSEAFTLPKEVPYEEKTPAETQLTPSPLTLEKATSNIGEALDAPK